MTPTLKYQIQILGTGTSTGIPMVGCKCHTCTSTNNNNHRLRFGAILKTPTKKNILIDTSPDLRQQLLVNDILHIDSVFITHDHADHIHGIDDLRPFCFIDKNRSIPIYTTPETANTLTQRFAYIFNRRPNQPIGGGIPKLHLEPISCPSDTIQSNVIEDENFEFFLLPHGEQHSLGFYHQGLLFLPDCHQIPPQLLDLFAQKKIDLLLITCVQKRPHTTHLILDRTFDYIHLIAPNRAGLFHMNHELEHDELNNLCQKNFSFPVFALYDNIILEY